MYYMIQGGDTLTYQVPAPYMRGQGWVRLEGTLTATRQDFSQRWNSLDQRMRSMGYDIVRGKARDDDERNLVVWLKKRGVDRTNPELAQADFQRAMAELGEGYSALFAWAEDLASQIAQHAPEDARAAAEVAVRVTKDAATTAAGAAKDAAEWARDQANKALDDLHEKYVSPFQNLAKYILIGGGAAAALYLGAVYLPKRR